jgi:hypothetical protein
MFEILNSISVTKTRHMAADSSYKKPILINNNIEKSTCGNVHINMIQAYDPIKISCTVLPLHTAAMF